MYGAANCDATAARRLYEERFPDRQIPDRRMFERVHRQLRETGTFHAPMEDTGRPRTLRTPDHEADILRQVENHPSISVRTLAASSGCSRHTVHNILTDDGLYPYHLQRVQALHQGDYIQRLEYCRWFLQMTETDPDFPGIVLFSDEAIFTHEGVFNFHNSHCWDHDNPHMTRPHSHQTRFSVNVWAGIVGDQLVGPYLFPDTLDGRKYYNFLHEILPELIRDVPEHIRDRMWFQHDGAPAHFSREVRVLLDAMYGQHWIGRGGPVAWPPRSPDLTSLDFFLWGHLKSLVYETPVMSREDLVARIVAAAGEIRETPDIFANVRRSMIRRYETCIRVGGRSFEQFL